MFDLCLIDTTYANQIVVAMDNINQGIWDTVVVVDGDCPKCEDISAGGSDLCRQGTPNCVGEPPFVRQFRN